MIRRRHQKTQTQNQKNKSNQSRQFIVVIIVALSFTVIMLISLLSALGLIVISWPSYLPLIFTIIIIALILMELLSLQYFHLSSSHSYPSLIRFVIPRFSTHISSTEVVYKGIEAIPPPTNPTTIQQRDDIVAAVYAKLTHETTSAVVLTGVDGVGKSTIASLTYQYVEKNRLANKGVFNAESIWLTINENVTMADLVGTILQTFSKPIPHLNRLTSQNQAKILVNALNSEDKIRLIVLDQFENFLNLQTGHVLAGHSGVSHWLTEVNSKSLRCKFLLTSRLRPQGNRVYSTTYLQDFPVKGLNEIEGVELLRKQKVLATDAELLTAIKRCGGHALSLVQLVSLLRRDYSLNLETLLKDNTYDKYWLGDIAQNSLDHVYKQQLNETERELLLLFSVFREAVPFSTLLSIMELSTDITDEYKQREFALSALLSQNLLIVLNGDRYQLQPNISSYIQEHLNENNELILQTTHAKAAQYYLQQATTISPPLEERRNITDVQPLIEAIWHLCQAKQWLVAYQLMERENIYIDLRRWGGISILLDLYQQLLPLDKLQLEPSQKVRIYNNLGKIYDNLGEKAQAKKYYKEALNICRKMKDLEGESWTLNNLSEVYSVLGNKKKARKYLEHALNLNRKIGDREGEGTTLNNLGRIFSVLGKKEQASEYLGQALGIFKEVKNYRGESRTLNNLAMVYDDLGHNSEAQRFLEQALNITREIGDRWGEGRVLNNLGRIYENTGQTDSAFKYFEQALTIRREVQDCGGQATTLNNLGRIYILYNQFEMAQRYLEQALSIFKEVGDRWGEGRALNNLGRVYFLKGEKKLAQRYYEQALNIFREVRDRRGKARVFNNLALLIADQQKEQALNYLYNALRICREVGDRRGEGWTLHNLGRVYIMLNQREQAQKVFERALQTRRETRDQQGEGWTLYNIGTIFFEQRRYNLALSCYILAKNIFDQIHSPDYDKLQSEINDLHKEIGDAEFIALLTKVESQASQIVEQALRDALNE